ncbi:MAG: Verru_Chthon cassette protein A [Chthoniobacterales bacterium]
MKHTPLSTQHQGAFALVVVLALIVLMVILVAGFLFRASTERTSSSGYSASVTARQLADKTVGVIQAQINEAATQGSNVAWVSQPGMVRTFNTSGNLIDAYKLYSASNMISDTVDLTADLPDGGWADDPAIWIDLNEPIEANSVMNYPIVDPSAAFDSGDVGAVEGFSITGAPGATAIQEAPLPVRWLYVLEDGSMVAPTGSGSNAVVAGASASNPIVGRVAFWTDDDSTKVNINTASEGSYWDTPRGYTSTEVYDLALKQPVFGEYNRFPGHPGSTSVSSVFPLLPALSPLPSVPSRSQRNSRAAELKTRLEKYLKLTPDYAFGGSEGGTVPIDPNDDPAAILKKIEKKRERHYSSVDEMMFAANRDPNSLLTRELLESRRFFLTPHSRAPETNLFNLPRVAIWPIYKLSGNSLINSRTTIFDKTIALCASTGVPSTSSFDPYFFQRELSLDPTNDYANISRNQELYGYLQKITQAPTPGFGGNFLAKYGADRNQILTEIFDFVRSVNLYDDQLAEGQQFTTHYHFGSQSGGPNPDLRSKGGATVAPIRIGNTMGQGRYFSMSQLGIVFIACADAAEASSNDPATNPMLKEPFPAGNPSDGSGTALNPGEKRVQAMILPTFFSTMIGWRLMSIYMRVEIDGLNTLTLNGNNLAFPASGWFEQAFLPHAVNNHSGYQGGVLAPHALLWNLRTQLPGSMPLTSARGKYPFISRPITVNSGSMNFGGGGPITVRIYVGNDVSGHEAKLVQTITLQFPSSQVLPTPTLFTRNSGSVKHWTFFSIDSPSEWPGWRGRLLTTNSSRLNYLVNPSHDVARAMTAYQGDFRLTGGLPEITVADGLYKEHPDYTDATLKWAMLWPGQISTADPSKHQKLISSSSYDNDIALPNSTGPTDLSGDFDNGAVLTHFGGAPGVNKPDEGQIDRKTANAYPQEGGAGIPYYASRISNKNAETFFSPNRIIPSPVAFGSLPTGVQAHVPWRTLLFRPAASYETAHSMGGPSDHLLLDLFWMPVVEPYVISDRFSTAGKVNMNYQIIPFTYVKRSTPMRAVLKNEKMTAIPTSISENNAFAPNIHTGGAPSPLTNYDFRKELDVDEILSQFEDRFDQPDKDTNVFISASEICDIHMVPQGSFATDMTSTFWLNNRMTGDNMRERIYSTVYPRLTTKSNTYTVHFRAQALKKVPGTPEGTWVEGRDVVQGEYRGSTTIERFINPDANIPDYAAASNPFSAPTLDTFYKWRVLSHRQFAP